MTHKVKRPTCVRRLVIIEPVSNMRLPRVHCQVLFGKVLDSEKYSWISAILLVNIMSGTMQMKNMGIVLIIRITKSRNWKNTIRTDPR